MCLHLGTPGTCFRRERRRAFCRLVSPAEGTSALALVRFNQVHACARINRDTRAISRSAPPPPPQAPVFLKVAHFSVGYQRARPNSWSMVAGGKDCALTAARRRRQRRLRSWVKHARQSVAISLAEYTYDA